MCIDKDTAFIAGFQRKPILKDRYRIFRPPFLSDLMCLQLK